MPSLKSLTAFVALAGVTFASPIDSMIETRGNGNGNNGNGKGNQNATDNNGQGNAYGRNQTFSIQQRAGKQYQKSPARSMLSTYQKYSAVPPTDVKLAAAAASGTAKGTVAANPESWDVEYLSPVTVGGSTLNLDFDTGSADLWLFSNLMPSDQSTGHYLYTPSSSASQKSGYTWNIAYGDGSRASGVVYADKVVVGGVTATSQAVEAATSVSSSFTSDTGSDGLLGLAFSSINTVSPVKQTTFFDTVKSTLALPLFTTTLKKGTAGSYDFGYINTTRYTGGIAYSSVNIANGYWQFTATGYQVGSSARVNTNYDAIADTGTTLMYLPAAIVQAYYAKVSGAQYNSQVGGWIFPCNAVLPNFSVVVAGQQRTVPGSYINWAPVSSTMCFGGMQYNTGIGFTILGDVFLKSQFVVFDSRGPVIGFAQQE